MLDFNQLSASFRVTVPVFEKQFIFHKKRYTLNCRDGWFEVEITNNRARPVQECTTPEGKQYHWVRGYTHDNEIVFQNFDVAKRKFGLSMKAPLRFNHSQTFEAIKAIVWEDRKVYWVEPDYSCIDIFSVRDIYESDSILLHSEKGITPEMRSLFLFHCLQRDQQKQLLAEAKFQEDHKKFLADIPLRLRMTFSQAGAELVKYSMSGDRIIVDWRISGSTYHYNSVINSRTFMVHEAGYCMSNDDKRHNITSMVKTAEEYEQKDLTYITRR